MKKILERLWYGDIYPPNQRPKKTKEVTQLMKYMADHHENLQATFSDEQKDLFERFDDCYTELTSINEREIFVYAFKLGARIAIEVMTLGDDEEIL